jgi:serine/threonine protein kinase
MNSKAKEEAAKEASLLAKLDNRYIVKYYESFVSKAKLNIIMEYCE